MLEEIHELRTRLEQVQILTENLDQKPRQFEYQQLLNFFYDSVIPTLILSKQGEIVAYNPAMQRLTGYTHEQLPNIPAWMQSIYPDEAYRQHAIEVSSRSRQREIDVKKDVFTITRNNGEIRHVEFSVYDILHVGAPTDLQVVQGEDVTERIQAEEALAESEHRFRSIIEQSLEGICLVDEQGQVIVWNHAFEKITGIKASEALNRGLWDVQYRMMPEERRTPKMYENLTNAVHNFQRTGEAAGSDQIMEQELVRIDGAHRIVEARITPIRTGKGVILASVCKDITDRKQAEEKLRESGLRLRESEQTLRQIFEMSPVALAIMLPESGLILEANASFLSLFGYTADEAVGKTGQDLHLYKNWEERQTVADEVQRNGYVLNLPIEMQHKDGSPLTVMYSANIIQYQGQTCVVAAAMDISELMQIHETLMEEQKMAGLGTLVAGLAHEMNSPLQVITGSVDDILEKLKNGEQIEPPRLKKQLELASRNTWRIAEIVRALLIYAYPMKMKTEACEINLLMQDSVLLIENRLKSNDIGIQFVLEEGLPTLDCEAGDLVQVLVALLKNAADALPHGGKIILSSAYDPTQKAIKLTIEDNGIGIAAQDQHKIFDPFFTTKPPGQGLGLGLTVVQGMLRKYGGRIKVESAPDEGSTFSLFFPLKNTVMGVEMPFKAEGRYKEK